MGWRSLRLLLLLLLVAPSCSASSTNLNVRSEDKIIFDCTLVLNELLLLNNRSSGVASTSLLRTAINGSDTIYYEWDTSVEHFLPQTFPKIVGILESIGWKLGVTGGRGGGRERAILLSISMSKSLSYLERLATQAIAQNLTVYELLFPSFGKIKPQHWSNASRPPIIILHSFASENSCDIFPGLQITNRVVYANTTMRLLLGSSPTPGTAAVEYNENQMDCENLPSPSINVLVVLSIELVSATRFPESYGLFSDLMSSLVTRNENFLNRNKIPYNRRPLLRLRLQPPSVEGSSSSSSQDGQIERDYATLLSRYAAQWAESEAGNTVIIEATHQIISNLGGKVQDFVPTMTNLIIPNLDSSPNSGCNNVNLISSSPELALLISQRFNLIFLRLSDKNIFECVECWHRWCGGSESDGGGGGQTCESSKFRANGNNNSLKLLIDIDLDNHHRNTVKNKNNEPDLEQALELFEHQHHNSTTHITHLPIHAILFRSSLSREEFAQASVAFKGISETFGCTIQFSVELTIDVLTGNDDAFANRLSEICHLPQTNLILYEIEHIIGQRWMVLDPSTYSSVVQPRLSVISSGVRKLKVKFPDVSVILKLPEARFLYTKNENECYSLFCSAQVENANKMVEAFVTWSYIHKIPIIIKDILSTDTHVGWWDRLLVAPECGTGEYVTRNHPKTMGYLEGRMPCLERLEDSPQSPIPILASGRMGCTIHVPELVSTQQELQVMLGFALHKFSRVEIIAGSSLHQIIPQLEQALLKSINQSHNIFLQVQLKKPGLELQMSQLIKLPKLVLEELKSREYSFEGKPIISVQISSWEEYQQEAVDSSSSDLSNTDVEAFIRYTSAANVPIGVVIGNCSGGGLLEKGILLSKTFLLHFSFLVCTTTWDIKYISEQTDSSSPTYFAIMTGYMDQLYAIKTAFHRKFPDKEIYFRPEFSTSSSPDYLRTVRDVNRHAELYEMKYFAVNAFDYPSTDRGSSSSSWKQGWWRVEDMANLSNVFNYFERESEHLSLSQWRPPPIEKEKEEKSFPWWIFVPSGVGFILVVLALALFAIWKRAESRYLTKIEELEFLNGVVSPHMEDGADAMSSMSQFLNMKFDKDFEISKTNLQSAAIIGAGNFGIVYKALVNGALVAVKIPKGGVSPNLFKTTLHEIKIMCYVGRHENVVRFVGAYIKDIGRGIVQIATELCVNGTLLSHLRGLSRSIVGTAGEKQESLSELVAAFDLERFCMEIAAGMDFLSSKRVIHGDLATRNVLLHEHFTCKIGDFGSSRKMYEYETYVKEKESQEEALPWRWMSFETLDKREFSVKSDVWSYGVTAWEIYSLGSVPYPDANWTTDFVTSIFSGRRLQKPKYSTDELFGKLLACWNIEPEGRPTFSELCQYFRNIRHGQYAPVLCNVQESTF